MKSNFFDIYVNSFESCHPGRKPTYLIGLHSKHWNKSFYIILLRYLLVEASFFMLLMTLNNDRLLFISVLYSNNAYFIIDPQWPVNYALNTIEKVQPNFIIFFEEHEKSELADTLLKTQNYQFIETKSIKDTLNNIKLLKNTKQTASSLSSEDVVYVITTSGTTGLPKVIQVCDSSISANIVQLSDLFRLTPSDVIYQASALTFDPSVVEIFCGLFKQSTVLVLPQIFKLMPSKLDAYLRKYRVTFLQVVFFT